MQYMLMMYETDSELNRRNEPAEAGKYWAGWNAYIEALGKAGIIIHGNGLQEPQTATTVRITGGKRHVQDGPFAETREQLGGYFIIEAKSLDDALEWAARAPCAAAGGVEVRPVMLPMQ